MQENSNQEKSNLWTFNIRDVLLAIRKHIVLIIAIVIAFTGAGAIYSFLLEPEYTVTQKLIYRCENKNYMSGDKEIIANTTTSNINTMVAYGDTIIDLFDEGVVVDRANFYYNEYLNKKQISEKEAENYLAELEAKVKSDEKDESYTPPKGASEQLNHIDKSKMSSVSLSTESETSFAFNVSYTAPTTEEASEKLAVLVHAFALECKETKLILGESGEKETVKYFGEFEVIVSDLGVEGVNSSVSKVKTVALFFGVGVVVALLLTLLLNLLDNTIKSKKELEEILEAPTLSLVEKWEE